MTQTPRRILAVMDDSDAQAALHTAARLADKHGAELRVQACLETPHDLDVIARLTGQQPDLVIAGLMDQRRADAEAKIARALPGRQIVPHVTAGKTFVEIVRHVAATGCDFVVKAAEPLTGLATFLFSSTDQHLLRKCPCPVWLQTPAAPAAPRHILAAVDLETDDADEPETLRSLNHRVISAAHDIAAGGADTRITVLHAWDAPGEGLVWSFAGGASPQIAKDRYINEIIATRRRAMDLFLDGENRAGAPNVVGLLERGTPEQVIDAQSRALGADVVVMGTVARTGLGGVIIGNTAENIINRLDCPVVAVKPDGFVCPLL